MPSIPRLETQIPSRQALPNSPPAPANASAGSDRYPGSEPIKVENVSLPEIGVPVATEVYTTSDTVTAVINYYKQRYPDAEVTEVNGQQVIAVNNPTAPKAIAIGTTGSETRIAIVQPK